VRAESRCRRARPTASVQTPKRSRCGARRHRNRPGAHVLIAGARRHRWGASLSGWRECLSHNTGPDQLSQCSRVSSLFVQLHSRSRHRRTCVCEQLRLGTSTLASWNSRCQYCSERISSVSGRSARCEAFRTPPHTSSQHVVVPSKRVVSKSEEAWHGSCSAPVRVFSVTWRHRRCKLRARAECLRKGDGVSLCVSTASLKVRCLCPHQQCRAQCEQDKMSHGGNTHHAVRTSAFDIGPYVRGRYGHGGGVGIHKTAV
jgi:hypothetical protein